MLLGGGWKVRVCRAHRACRVCKALMLLGGGWEVRAWRARRARKAHMLLGWVGNEMHKACRVRRVVAYFWLP